MQQSEHTENFKGPNQGNAVRCSIMMVTFKGLRFFLVVSRWIFCCSFRFWKSHNNSIRSNWFENINTVESQREQRSKIINTFFTKVSKQMPTSRIIMVKRNFKVTEIAMRPKESEDKKHTPKDHYKYINKFSRFSVFFLMSQSVCWLQPNIIAKLAKISTTDEWLLWYRHYYLMFCVLFFSGWPSLRSAHTTFQMLPKDSYRWFFICFANTYKKNIDW